MLCFQDSSLACESLACETRKEVKGSQRIGLGAATALRVAAQARSSISLGIARLQSGRIRVTTRPCSESPQRPKGHSESARRSDGARAMPRLLRE